MITLCEKCRNNDWRHMQEIIDIFKAADLERPKSIWCAASDRPEDLHYETCADFEPFVRRVHRKEPRRMNEYQRRLMDKPRIKTTQCPFCGRVSQSRHHIVPRSQGGAKGPTVTVCGFDNVTGCHGRFHQHTLHLDWNDTLGCWEYYHSKEPMDFDEARRHKGWIPMPNVTKRGAA